MDTVEEETQVSKAEAYAGVIERTATTTGKAAMVPYSGRMPGFRLVQIEAMAGESGKTRNAMINMVIEAGLEAITAHLSPDTVQRLRQREAAAPGQLLNGDGGDGEWL